VGICITRLKLVANKQKEMLIIGSTRFFTDGKLDANEGSTNEPLIPERETDRYTFIYG
jgi:hypothetical protein